MIHLFLSEQQTDYVYRLLMRCPMVEVETLVLDIRRQVQRQDAAGADMGQASPQTGLGAPNGQGQGEDIPALP